MEAPDAEATAKAAVAAVDTIKVEAKATAVEVAVAMEVATILPTTAARWQWRLILPMLIAKRIL
jgi:hypothetical protein